MHLVHLILTLITAGFWVVIWIIAGLNAAGANHQERQRYARELEAYRQEYDQWQQRHHQFYG